VNKDEALNIAGDFQNSLRKSDKSFIEKYTKEQIKCALSLTSHSDSNHQWYKEMERRVAELDDLAKVSKWQKSYFWDKIFPIILTVILTGVVSFTAGYYLKLVEIRGLKKEVQTLKARESTIQSEIKKAIDSGNPSDILDVFNKLNRQK